MVRGNFTAWRIGFAFTELHKAYGGREAYLEDLAGSPMRVVTKLRDLADALDVAA